MEISFEEKYKNLVEAIKEFRDLNCHDEGIRNWVNDNVPELAENDDERIRKVLLEIFSNASKNDWRGIPNEKVIAWLEKQGKSYTKKDVDDAYLKGISDTKNEIEKQYEADYQIRKDIATFIFNYRGDIKDRAKWMDYLGVRVYVFEKQADKPKGKTALEAIKEEKVDNRNCVKSDDEIKRKFEIGYWICNGGGNPCKVNDIFGNYYELCSIEGYEYNKLISDIDTNYHLWTIDDAKDHDILTVDGRPFIYCCNDNYKGNYCCIDSDGKFRPNLDFGFNGKTILPATKEQRDLILQMSENTPLNY